MQHRHYELLVASEPRPPSEPPHRHGWPVGPRLPMRRLRPWQLRGTGRAPGRLDAQQYLRLEFTVDDRRR